MTVEMRRFKWFAFLGLFTIYIQFAVLTGWLLMFPSLSVAFQFISCFALASADTCSHIHQATSSPRVDGKRFSCRDGATAARNGRRALDAETCSWVVVTFTQHEQLACP